MTSSAKWFFVFHIGCCCQLSCSYVYQFLDLTLGFIYYWYASNFKMPHFFSIYISLSFFYFFIVFYDWYIIIRWHWHIDLKACFFSFILIFLATLFGVFFCLDCKISANSRLFGFLYSFCLVFIQFFKFRYPIVMKISYFIISFFFFISVRENINKIWLLS